MKQEASYGNRNQIILFSWNRVRPTGPELLIVGGRSDQTG